MGSSNYEPLKTSSSTRLLALSPGTPDDPISSTLKVDLEEFPEYDAISYTWGEDTGARCTIDINNHPTLIRPNLFSALRRVGSPDAVRNLWVDDLSIAQDDLVEKAQQVFMIGRISRQARCVRAWLGEQADDDGTVFQGLKEAISDRTKLYMDALFILAFIIFFPVGIACVVCAIVGAGNRATIALEVLEISIALFLFGRTWHREHSRTTLRKAHPWQALVDFCYWSRTWIIQEPVLAQKVLLHCGNEVSDWDALMAFAVSGSGGQPTSYSLDLRHLRNRHEFKRDYSIFRIKNLRRSAGPGNSYQRQKSIATLIHETRNTSCADQRDRVYSLLSLDHQQTDEQHINPNYQKTLPQL